ncbi:hypothetical protein MHK_001994 [Candidatus Magnetomorum sp. HK-1]|nr:hypothetical protein MHK_001994 [Candidatus Magnetomorum sp. HK-1]
MNIYKLKQFLLTGLFIFLFTGYGYCGFRATIHAEGEYSGGQNQADVVIGIGPQESKKMAIPAGPKNTCNLGIVDPKDWSEGLQEWIQKIGEQQFIWVLVLDPHGKDEYEGFRTSTMSWNPDELGPGTFELRKGFDQNGELVIPDMKSVTSISDSDNAPAAHYYAIIYKPDYNIYSSYYLSQIIKTLRLLTNTK